MKWMGWVVLVIMLVAGCSAPQPRPPSQPVVAGPAPVPPVPVPPVPPQAVQPAPTPSMTEQERQELEALALRLWAMAVHGDLSGLSSEIAPEQDLAAPGGEFIGEGYGTGLPAVIQWAGERAGSKPVVSVKGRKSYSIYDLMVVDTGSGHFAVYVTIKTRKLVKIFAVTDFYRDL